MHHDVDVVVLGSGFSGSLLAQILCRTGRSVALVDNRGHPRFAIGESSTPSANLILKQLADRYGLEGIHPLSSYGSWQQAYPEIGCGIKRGFSYFKHQRGKEFQTGPNHENELLVAASNDDSQSDTHWFRQDVDALFCQAAGDQGTLLLQYAETTRMDYDPLATPAWEIEVTHAGQPVLLRAAFVVDATGAGGVLQRFLKIPDQTDQLQTRSSALYAHFRQVKPWHDELSKGNDSVSDHPFDCDHSAQHHLLEDSWCWLLRFNQGITSVGLMMDQTRPGETPGPVEESSWQERLALYPSLQGLLQDATIVDPPGRLVVAGRVQRMCGQAAGAHWAMLPHTAGFIDPLHSTGIAHTLSGIERLAVILDQLWDSDQRVTALHNYHELLMQELSMIDRLVYGCYRSLNHFPWFVSYSMLYFVAAIRYEQNRLDPTQESHQSAFLGADDADWNQTVDQILQRLETGMDRSDRCWQEAGKFESEVWEALKPFDSVGLSSPKVQHMYPHTAAF